MVVESLKDCKVLKDEEKPNDGDIKMVEVKIDIKTSKDGKNLPNIYIFEKRTSENQEFKVSLFDSSMIDGFCHLKL